jgi:hypothetical protein
MRFKRAANILLDLAVGSNLDLEGILKHISDYGVPGVNRKAHSNATSVNFSFIVIRVNKVAANYKPGGTVKSSFNYVSIFIYILFHRLLQGVVGNTLHPSPYSLCVSKP